MRLAWRKIMRLTIFTANPGGGPGQTAASPPKKGDTGFFHPPARGIVHHLFTANFFKTGFSVIRSDPKDHNYL
jgi:hypothetical protein